MKYHHKWIQTNCTAQSSAAKYTEFNRWIEKKKMVGGKTERKDGSKNSGENIHLVNSMHAQRSHALTQWRNNFSNCCSAPALPDENGKRMFRIVSIYRARKSQLIVKCHAPLLRSMKAGFVSFRLFFGGGGFGCVDTQACFSGTTHWHPHTVPSFALLHVRVY